MNKKIGRFYYRTSVFIDFEDIALVIRARETKNGKKEELERYFPVADDYHGPRKPSEDQQRMKDRLKSIIVLTKVQIDINLVTIIGNMDHIKESKDATAQTVTLKCDSSEVASATYKRLTTNNIITQNGIELFGPNLW